MKERRTLLFSQWKTLAAVAVVLSGVAAPPHAAAQTLRLSFGFEDAGTPTADSVAGATLNINDVAGTPTDLHGVAGLGQALDFTSSATQGGTGPLALTNPGTGLTVTNLLPLDQ